jgi:hypothetical protein
MAMYLLDVWAWAQAPLGIGSLWLFVVMLRRVLDAFAGVVASARDVLREIYALFVEARALLAASYKTGSRRGRRHRNGAP